MSRIILSINKNESMNFLLHTLLSKKYSFIAVQDVYQGMIELKNESNIIMVIVDIDDQIEVLEFLKT